jgi:acetyl esterase/lipase
MWVTAGVVALGAIAVGLRASGVLSSRPSNVNTGQPGSTCAPTSGGLKVAPLEPGTSTGLLGKAPAYYEVGAPSGLYAGRAAKGIIIVVHGGGWSLVGSGAVSAERPVADQWRNMGWTTINVTYPACNGLGELATLEWFYDRAALVAAGMPVGAEGDSAGGELVLLLAEHRPLSFAVSRGGPTDLTSIANQPAWDPTHRAYDQTGGPENVYYSAVAAFGPSELAAMSPALSPTRPTGRVLQGLASTDFLVPPAQLRELGVGNTDIVPGPGTVQWVHGTVTPAGASAFQATLDRMLRGLT